MKNSVGPTTRTTARKTGRSSGAGAGARLRAQYRPRSALNLHESRPAPNFASALACRGLLNPPQIPDVDF
ncbi:hypothetical protein I551_1795 [Mycobacterium ulcerans str. Harvey]|uniref:Uncharacterized protein n=1 Tax=Mycobacterium ulcerans str. Harvey TaxID=1299332 RepID=A0ABP3AKN7_MYCUL|nr:hypothetical protein I551_1795 [Mycobacterium ulcerans str. Harvey]